MAKKQTLKWIQKEVDITSLKPHTRNPRKISEEAFARLKKSLSEDGDHGRILVAEGDNEHVIIAGHQRWKAMRQLGWKKVNVLVPSRSLTAEEFRRILIKDNLHDGTFDFDILSADYAAEELESYGMPAEWLCGAITEEDEEKPLKEKPAQEVICPNCGEEFEP